MDLLSTIFNSEKQTASSIRALNNTVSQMGVENISHISMRGYKSFGEFRIRGQITLEKGNIKVEQEFEATNFVDLFNQIVSFCKNM